MDVVSIDLRAHVFGWSDVGLWRKCVEGGLVGC